MGKFILLSSAVVLLVASLACVQGLKCYSCYDADFLNETTIAYIKAKEGWNPLPHILLEPSKLCTKGDKLDSNMIKDCKPDQKNVNDTAAEVICVTAKIDVDMKDYNITDLPEGFELPKNFSVVARGCVHYDGALEKMEKKECTDTSRSHLEHYALGPLKELFNATEGEMPELGLKIDICPCDGDSCNPASAVAPGVLSLLATLLVLPFALR